jgi:iron complex outermembrane receptor protein
MSGSKLYSLGQQLQAARAAFSAVAGVGALIVMPVQSARSQDAAATENLEEVVVTAQKRRESIQDVPLSITAMTEVQLERMGAKSFEDYARGVPGLAFVSEGPGQKRVIIRGISSNGGPATVGVYIDETPITDENRVGASDPKLFDIERVEVLRGPQGTLYGASSMGGTIRLITRQPDPSVTSGWVNTSVSNTSQGGFNGDFGGMLNAPLVQDKIALRAVAYYGSSEGYIDRVDRSEQPVSSPTVPDPRAAEVRERDEDVNSETTEGVRVALRYDITDKLSLVPSVYYQRTDLASQSTRDSNLEGLRQARYLDEPKIDEFTLYNVTADYDLGWAHLLSSTSYFDRGFVEARDLTDFVAAVFGLESSPPGTLDDRTEVGEFTQELRIASSGDSRLQYVLGAYYNKRERDFTQSFIIDGFSAETGIPIDQDMFFVKFDEDSEQQLAVFGDLKYSLTESLQISAGLRWFDIEQESIGRDDGLFNGGPSADFSSAQEDGISPKFLMSYSPGGDALLYASAAKGFRPGSPIVPPPESVCGDDLAELGITSNVRQIESDELWNYEVGNKLTLADGRMTINTAAFYADWKKIPQGVLLPCGFGILRNVGQASSKGFELETSAAPFDDLQLSAAVGYVDARLEADAPELGGVKGDRLTESPEWTYSASAQWSFPIARYQAYVRGDYQYVDSVNTTFSETPVLPGNLSTRPAYSIANFRFGLHMDGWEAAVFLNNAFDERAILTFQNFGTPGVSQLTTNRPRTIGLSVRLGF